MSSIDEDLMGLRNGCAQHMPPPTFCNPAGYKVRVLGCKYLRRVHPNSVSLGFNLEGRDKVDKRPQNHNTIVPAPLGIEPNMNFIGTSSGRRCFRQTEATVLRTPSKPKNVHHFALDPPLSAIQRYLSHSAVDITLQSVFNVTFKLFNPLALHRSRNSKASPEKFLEPGVNAQTPPARLVWLGCGFAAHRDAGCPMPSRVS